MDIRPPVRIMAWLGPLLITNVVIWVAVFTPEVRESIAVWMTTSVREWVGALSGWVAAIAAFATIHTMRKIHNKQISQILIRESLCIRPAVDICRLLVSASENLTNAVDLYGRENMHGSIWAFSSLFTFVEQIERLLLARDLVDAEKLASMRPAEISFAQATTSVANLKSFHAFMIEAQKELAGGIPTEIEAQWLQQAKSVADQVTSFAKSFAEDALAFQNSLMTALSRTNPDATTAMEQARTKPTL